MMPTAAWAGQPAPRMFCTPERLRALYYGQRRQRPMKIMIESDTKCDEHTIPIAEMRRIEIAPENGITLRIEEITDDGFTIYSVSRHRPTIILRSKHRFDLRFHVDE
jgi:hypothetical protein